MRLKDIGISLRDEKKVLRNGMILLVFAAVLVLVLMRFDQVWGAVLTVVGTVAPVFYGIVLAYILNVFVHFFEDVAFKPLRNVKSKLWKRVRRPLAVALAYLLVALVLVSIIAFIIPGLIESMGILADTVQQTVPGYVTSAMNWLNEFAQENDLTFIQDFLRNFNWSNVLSSASAVLRDFLSSLVGVTINVASGVFAAVMGFIFSVYMLMGKEKLLRGVKSTLLAFLPRPTAQKIGQIATLTNRMFFNFIRGQLLECVILGSLCYVGMSILQLDYALLISSVVTLGALIPILGAYIGAAVGVLILLLVHPIDALIFLIFLLILQQVEGNMIYPRVVGSSIGLPPLWTLFAVVFWGGVLGIPGILFGTPATAVIYQLLRTSVRTRLRQRNIDPKDPQFPLPPEEDEASQPPDQQRLDDV
ncbi:AI-2E family transporter [Acutalibacter sp. LFL-21]|uniref:AI-2E family transporter n=1 Tax=Acutalibacter sp. LFL-21 TaxID=2983399 RepID=UPI0021D670C6|nr:AI-2E family transporter [Acutalibacter sp. LFL-21]MCU7652657.1 AI-2E family transporter [Acutalibacter sp. LFL-21]